MGRRSFIKNFAIITGIVAGRAILSKSVLPLLNVDNKKMKILVITGSPRKNGNSKIIASEIWTEGSVNNTDYPKQAYELGKSL